MKDKRKGRRIAIFGAALAAALCLSACGGGAPEGSSAAPDGNSTEPANTPAADIGTLEKNFTATIEETVLLDEKDVKITAKELTYQNGYAAELSLLLENNTDKELNFYAETLSCAMNSINGYMVPDGYISETVAAGMSANATMTFELDQLAILGITDIAEIGVGFEIQNDTKDYLTTGPLVIKTDKTDSYDSSKDTFAEAMDGMIVPAAYGFSIDYRAAEPLLDEKGVKILNQYVITNKDGQQTLFMEAINNSDKGVYLAEADVSVNGLSVSSGTWDSEYILPGKRAVLSLAFDNLLSKKYMELLGMQKYSSCAFKFDIMDHNYKSIGSKDAAISFGGNDTVDGFAGDVLYDKNGFTFMKVGIVEDELDISDDLHVLVLVKNTSGKTVDVDIAYDSVYVNKMKVNDLTMGTTVQDGGYALVDISLMGHSLEDNGLDINSITAVSASFEIRDKSYDTLDEPKIDMTF